MGMVEFLWQQSQDRVWGLSRLQQRGAGNPWEIPAAGTGSCCSPQAAQCRTVQIIKIEKQKEGRFCTELPGLEMQLLGAPVAAVSPRGVRESLVPPPT